MRFPWSRPKPRDPELARHERLIERAEVVMDGATEAIKSAIREDYAKAEAQRQARRKT